MDMKFIQAMAGEDAPATEKPKEGPAFVWVLSVHKNDWAVLGAYNSEEAARKAAPGKDWPWKLERFPVVGTD
jgi:hypothetical protein